MRPLLLASVAFTSLVGSLLGYDIGIISGAIIYIEKDLHITEVQAEVIVGSLNLVSAFGGLSSGYIADRIGRKGTLGLATSIFIVGTFVMCISSSFGGLLLGRVIMGLGIGCGFVIGPLYAAELSPAKLRGALASLFEVAIGIGILAGYAGSYACKDLDNQWRIMIGLGLIPPLMILAFLVCLPESPRYLWAKGKEGEAIAVLNKVMEESEAEECINEMAAGAVLSPRSSAAAKEKNEVPAWKQLFQNPTPTTKMMMMVGFGVSVSQQANGSEAVVYYIPKILEAAGVEGDDAQLQLTILIGVCRTAFIAVGCYSVDRLGRRPLLVGSCAGISFALFLLSFGIATDAGTVVAIGALCLFMGSYAVGVGPVNMVLLSEIFPYHLRATAMAFGLFLNRLVSGIVASTFLSICTALTDAGAFFAFGCVATVSFLFVLKYVPETKGKSLEEMEEFFRSITAGGLAANVDMDDEGIDAGAKKSGEEQNTLVGKDDDELSPSSPGVGHLAVSTTED